jgi:hypothetical protein
MGDSPQKKPPAKGRGQEAFLLSHIKAPAQGGKAGGSRLPKPNLSNIKTDNKIKSNLVLFLSIERAGAPLRHAA